MAIPSDIQQQVYDLLSRASNISFVTADEEPGTGISLTPGQRVSAEVLTTLPNALTQVRVGSEEFKLDLPIPVRPGQTLEMTFVSDEPRATFAIARPGVEGPQVSLSDASRLLSLLASSEQVLDMPEAKPPVTTPRPQSDVTSATLSDAGRWLSLLEHTAEGITGQQMYVLDRLNAVLKSLPPDSPAFTAILDEAITYQPFTRGGGSPDSGAQARLHASPQFPYGSGNGVLLDDDMARLLQALIRGNRLALLEALNQQTLPTGLMPGQQLKGEVLSILGGGHFMVQIADQALEFIMPKGTRRGDRVNLFFITGEPVSTFLMVRFGRLSDSQVSETGRWLSTFLAASPSQMSAGAVYNMLHTLLSAPPSDASQLSGTLQQGLRESGLFYESHLARWFAGEYPLEELLREPQARLSPRFLQIAEKLGIPLDKLLPENVAGGLADVLETMLKQGSAAASREMIADQRTLPVLSEQLSLLQSGQLLFRGDLFPGQRLEWTLTERDAHGGASGRRERSWETTLRIDLPLLGAVGVRLRLDGVRVSMEVHAEDSEKVTYLETGRSSLTEQLEAAGLTPLEIVMRNAE